MFLCFCCWSPPLNAEGGDEIDADAAAAALAMIEVLRPAAAAASAAPATAAFSIPSSKPDLLRLLKRFVRRPPISRTPLAGGGVLADASASSSLTAAALRFRKSEAEYETVGVATDGLLTCVSPNSGSAEEGPPIMAGAEEVESREGEVACLVPGGEVPAEEEADATPEEPLLRREEAVPTAAEAEDAIASRFLCLLCSSLTRRRTAEEPTTPLEVIARWCCCICCFWRS